MRERIFFILKDTPSQASEKKLLAFGNIIPIGTHGLSEMISEIKSDDGEQNTIYLSAWEKVEIPKSTKSLRDIDVSNFLMSGNFNEDIFARDVIEKTFKLSINRTISDQIVKLIEDKRLKNAILTSNIGNGKTTALDSIAYKATARSMPVFRATRNSSLLLKEVPLIRQIPGPLLLLIDDAFGAIDVLKAIVALGRDDLFIITTARTSQFELQENEIKSLFANNLEEFSLDELDNTEISDLIAYMDNYALWGGRQAAHLDAKRKFVTVDCLREIRTVILEALDSPNIRARIQELIKFENDHHNRVGSTLILSQLLNLAQIRADISLISETMGFDARSALIEHENNLRDFALIQNGRISMRSPIFSEYVLKKLIDTASVIDVLSECMSNLDVIYDNDNIYKDVYKNFSRFRFVETAIAVEKRRVHMVKYFENIKELFHCRENSLFWLQYAMCRLSLHQYPEAGRLFDVAFAFAKKSGYRENRHLDNQYARFLLESRTSSDEYTDYMAAFNKAHTICIKQMRNEPLSHNPYRVAQNYYPFLDRRIAQLSTGDLVSIFRSCGEVNTFIRQRASNKGIRAPRKIAASTLLCESSG